MRKKNPLWFNLLYFWAYRKVPAGSGLTIPFLIGAERENTLRLEMSISDLLIEFSISDEIILIQYCEQIGEYVCCLEKLNNQEKSAYQSFGNLYYSGQDLQSISSIAELRIFFDIRYAEALNSNAYSKTNGQWNSFTLSETQLINKITRDSKPDRSGVIRRVDLHLRSYYPEIESTIYLLNDETYLIYVKNNVEPFQILNQKFDNSIKPITAPVILTEDIPIDFVEIVSAIKDSEISKNFEGISMTKFDLFNLLLSKFPDVYFNRLENEGESIKIFTSAFKENGKDVVHHRFLSNHNREKIETFLDNLKLGLEFEIIDEETECAPKLRTELAFNPVQYLYASGFWKNQIPQFAQRDEAIWYDNIDKIFSKEFNKTDLFFYDPKQYCCYVDYSSFDNINLRNFIFLFEVIYITPPFNTSLIAWLKKQHIKKVEFFELVKRGRFKILLTQPEIRYDIGFLNELYQEVPNAIISRRALSTLQQIDIVQMADNYILNDPKIIIETLELSKRLSKVLNVDFMHIYQTIIWPLKAKRKSFETLNRAGVFGSSHFGVNHAIEPSVSNIVNKDLSFEFIVCAPQIHLSHALNATYFPFKANDGFTDSFYTNIMGDMLNMYQNATAGKFKSYLQSKSEYDAGISPINPIDVIELNSFDSILDLESVLSKEVIYPNSKRLMETLAELGPKERELKITQYNAQVAERLNKRRKSKHTINLGKSVAEDAAGAVTGIPILGFLVALAGIANDKLSKNFQLYKSAVNKVDDILSGNMTVDESNIHYLTKINRVAKLKERD